MIYALVRNGAIVEYPYSFAKLRKDNPQVSYPRDPSDERLAEFGVVPVELTARPGSTATQSPVEGEPVLVGDRWRQVWTMRDASAEEIAERAEQATLDAEFDAAKLDAWMVQFLAMSPAEAQNFVLNNSANIAALRTNVGRLAYAVRFLLRRELRNV